MNIKHIAEKSIPELAEMIERRAIEINQLSEQLIYLANPQTLEAGVIIADVYDFALLVERGYDRVKSALNELQG